MKMLITPSSDDVTIDLKPDVVDAVAIIAVEALSRSGEQIDQGMWGVNVENLTLGEQDSGVNLGDWQVLIRRTKKP